MKYSKHKNVATPSWLKAKGTITFKSFGWVFFFLLVSSAQDSAFLDALSTHTIIQIHAIIQARAAMYRKTSQILKPLIFNSYKLEILINCVLKTGFVFTPK